MCIGTKYKQKNENKRPLTFNRDDSSFKKEMNELKENEFRMEEFQKLFF